MAAPGPNPDGFPRSYGKFELVRRLGDGGMAEVFLARLPGVAGFQKTLVLKRILPHLARKKHFVDLFVAEASLAAEVRHRNVVQVFELGQVSGELYMAMEYVEGYDLRRLLRYASKQGLRIPPWFTVHVVCEVLEALNYAYNLENEHGQARRVVHRDVTPSNIFISNQGEVKLGDFGVARDDTRQEQTRAGQLKGKVAYMAPEQLYSQPIDQRTDLFAIGVVLWECLAQRRLFGGRPDIEMMNAICEGQRQPPGAKLSDVPPLLDQIVLKALQPKPADRWRSASELQRALYGVLEQMRKRVSPSDVRAVQTGLTKEVGANAGLSGIKQVKHDTRTGDSSAPSFNGLSVGEDSSNRSAEMLANPVYGDRGDSVAELSIDLPARRSSSTRGPAPYGGLTNDLGLGAGASSDPARHLSSSAGIQAVEAPPEIDPPARVPPPRPSSGAYGFVRPKRDAPQPPPRASSAPQHPPPRVVTGVPMPRAPSQGAAARVIQGQPTTDLPVLRPPTGDIPIVQGTGDLDVDALVQQAVDDVRSELPEGAVVEQSSLIAGLDSRRLMGDARAAISDRWSFILDRELYDGPYPFFLVDHEGSSVGPCSYAQALKITKLEVKAGFGEKSRVGASPDRLMPARQMLELLGMETLLRGDRDLDRSLLDGEGRTPIRLFADYTRHPTSGRLLLFRDRNVQGDCREIEILGGEPTFVWTEQEELQYPQLLVKKRLLRPENVPELAHGAVLGCRPLEAVASARIGTDLTRYRPMLMKDRLVDLFTRGYASHTLLERTEIVNTSSFAPNLLQVGLELTFRCVPRDLIDGYVRSRASRKTKVSADFDRIMAQLSLSPEILTAVALIKKGKPLERLLEAHADQRRTLTTLAFFLSEADLLHTDA